MAKLRQLDIPGLHVDEGFVYLPTKPGARMHYAFIASTDGRAPPSKQRHLLVFLSGLDNPLWVWQKAILSLASSAAHANVALPPMLLYDRFGVGRSDPDPTDVSKAEDEHHDALDAVSDLQDLLRLQRGKQGASLSENGASSRIIFVAHSFGVAIARLYIARYPNCVDAVLLMDSAITSTPAERFIPNPDDINDWQRRGDWHAAFLDQTLITEDQCREAIQRVRASPISGFASLILSVKPLFSHRKQLGLRASERLSVLAPS